MGYPDFMNTVSHTLHLGREKELSNIPSSLAHMESASTASSSMQLPDVLPLKRAPANDPLFWSCGKQKIMFC
jgi:hypothetical protein